MARWRYLMLHHGAGQPGETVEQMRAQHKRQGWRDIGYHYVLQRAAPDFTRGHLKVGRPDTQSGAHAGVSNYNAHGIGLCVPGYFHPGHALSEHMPESLYQDLLAAVLHLMQHYDIPFEHLKAHRDVKQTACPGEWFPMMRLRVDVAAKLRGG